MVRFDTRGPARDWRHAVAAVVVAFGCLYPAVRIAHDSLRHVTRPYDIDQYRDIANAQSIADGNYPADPYYRGESVWYNPLLPASVAVISRVTGADVPVALVRAGPFLNALGPAALFVLVAITFGPWPAVAALLSLVYAAPGADPVWASPSYSPWLFATNYASGFFYLGLLFLWRASERPTTARWAVAGGVLGVTFLTHTAPAVVLGLTTLLLVASGARRPSSEGTPAAARWLAVYFGAAVLVSVPYLWSILGHYHLHIVNPAPNDWVWGAMKEPDKAIHGNVNPRNALALVGLLVVIARARRDAAARLVLSWLVSAALLFVYGYAQRSSIARWTIPLIPQFHFYFLLRACGHVLAGVGAWTLIVLVMALLARRARPAVGEAMAAAIAAVLGVIFMRESLPAYARRPAFEADRALSLHLTFEATNSEVFSRLRTETSPGSVVLATADRSLTGVGPADRAVVALPPAFSNPYVPFDERSRDQQRMLAALASGERGPFETLARRWNVTHVLLAPGDVPRLSPAMPLRLVSNQGGAALYAVELQ